MTTDLDAFEASRWAAEGWERGREDHIARLKGQASGLTKRRIGTFQWTEQIVAQVEEAYAALGLERGESIGGVKLAQQLSRQGVRTQRGTDPVKLADKGKAWADALISETDASLIDEAVMECRTLMTARCLSANFDGETLDALESRYVEIIADILAVGRRLRNQPPLPRPLLLEYALRDARSAAQDQRREKPPVTMAARERYWRDRPAPIRKIFE